MAPVSPTRTPRVNLSKYVNIGDDQWRFCQVVVSANGRMKPDYVVVDGLPQLHREGSYYIEWYDDGRRVRRSVGKDALQAVAARDKQAHLLAAKAHGIDVPMDPSGPRITLSEACADFLDEVRRSRRTKTFQQYNVALRYFEQFAGRTKRLSQLERKDLLDFKHYLVTEKGVSSRTVRTKLAVVIQLLKANEVTGLMRKGDWPRYVQAEPDVYTREELSKFFATCDDRQRLVFQFLWQTGFREGEVQYVTKRDLDLINNTARVTPKPSRGFVPKDWEEREVPIPEVLAQPLRHHVKALGPGDLLFPTSTGHVHHHFLSECKAIALKAGLNCGNCDNGKELCVDKPICENWFLHKFRATFATMHLHAGVDLRTVQHWMGHKDLASTMRYLKPARGREAQAKVNATFA